MSMVVTTKASSSPAYVAKSPPPLPPPPPPKGYGSYNGHAAAPTTTSTTTAATSSAAAAPWMTTAPAWPGPGYDVVDDEQQALDGVVLALRATAALAAFVAASLVASCRHGDWMEFPRYHEYTYLLGASAVACVYSAAQALRTRMRAGSSAAAAAGPGLLDFAGDQAVAYLLLTASSAALPITIRMRSAVINLFTDAITAAIGLASVAFAALAFSAMLSAFRLSQRLARRTPY